MGDGIDTYVLIPYKDDHAHLADCLGALWADLPTSAGIVVVADGPSTGVAEEELLREYALRERVEIIRHEKTQGPASARNSGLDWCRRQGAEVVILLDSDCLPGRGFVQAHIEYHACHPDVACVGGPIRGVGGGVWARVDGVMSWFTSIPGSPEREVTGLYHIPTTNMSVKPSQMPDWPVFDARLRTGEDVAFLKRLQQTGRKIRYVTTPTVEHQDRTALRQVLRHQYRWATHTYTVRFGHLGLGTTLRLALACVFLIGIPFFGLAGSAINIYPWLKRHPGYAIYWPVLVGVYMFKGMGIVSGTLSPSKAVFYSAGRS